MLTALVTLPASESFFTPMALAGESNWLMSPSISESEPKLVTLGELLVAVVCDKSPT